MSHADGLCDNCGTRPPFPIAFSRCGYRVLVCRTCLGRLAAFTVAELRRYDAQHPLKQKRPRNVRLPFRDADHGTRCRECMVQLHDWTRGDPPYCGACKPEGAPR